jgi:hypothetical protein
MKRTVLSLLVVGLLAGVGTSAIADNVTAGTQPAAAADKDQNSQQPQSQLSDDPAAGGAIVSESDRAYLVTLKKCEPLIGADKTKCVDVAKKKSGQM